MMILILLFGITLIRGHEHDKSCSAFRLPPRAVNDTYLNEAHKHHTWLQPPFAFGYGKWALAWTTIEEYWTWWNIQNEWYPLVSHSHNNGSTSIQATVIADINSFQYELNDKVVVTPATDTLLTGEIYAWNYTIPADIMFDTDNTAWVGWGYDMRSQGAPYFLSYDASTTGVKNVSFGLSIYSAREGSPTDETVQDIIRCYDELGSKTFSTLVRSLKHTPTDGRRSGNLSWRAPFWRTLPQMSDEHESDL